MNLVLGVDIGSVDGNGTVDWDTAKANGLRFAILRACEGVEPDPAFHAYWLATKRAGIKRGAYLFLRWDESPTAQVDELLAQIGSPDPSDLPPTIDVEFKGGVRPPGMSAVMCLAHIMAAVNHFKLRTGFLPMLYTSYVVWVDPSQMANLPAPTLADASWWIKYWPWPIHTVAKRGLEVEVLPPPPCPPPAGNSWAIEQYMGDAIKWPGFVSTTDCDRFNVTQIGSKGDFVKWTQKRVGAVVDGDFGPKTRDHVIAFQQLHRLAADGIVGLDTFGYLAQVHVE